MCCVPRVPQVSSFLPLVLKAIMQSLDVSLCAVLAGYALAVVRLCTFLYRLTSSNEGLGVFELVERNAQGQLSHNNLRSAPPKALIWPQ